MASQTSQEHSPNHESTLSSTLKGPLIAATDLPIDYDAPGKDDFKPSPAPGTPSSWKSLRSRFELKDTETYPAVPLDSTQYWSGMFGFLFDTGGTSSPSVYVNYHLGLPATQRQNFDNPVRFS